MDRKGLAIPDSVTFVFVFLGILLLFIIFFFAFRVLDADLETKLATDSMDSIVATTFQSYMRQPVSLDIDGDGKAEETSVAELIAIADGNKAAEKFLENLTGKFFDNRMGIYWKLDVSYDGSGLSYGHSYAEKVVSQSMLAPIFSPIYAPMALEIMTQEQIKYSSGEIPKPDKKVVKYEFTYWVLFRG
jgi:hypothetical protein